MTRTRALSFAANDPPGWSKSAYSQDKRHRWTIGRRLTEKPWGESKRLLAIGLYPSPESANRKDSEALSELVKLSKGWGYDRLACGCLTSQVRASFWAMGNEDPDAAEANAMWLTELALQATDILCAWGPEGRYLDRGRKLVAMLQGLGLSLHYLGRIESGEPAGINRYQSNIMRPYIRAHT